MDSAGTDLRWDRFQPAGSGPWPAVVLLHVGGFKSGERGPADVARDLQAAGFLVFAAEYRLAPPGSEMLGAGPPGDPQFNPPSGGRPPEQTNDVGAAIVAARHDSHSNGKVVVLGGSAGASHSVFATAFSGESRPDVAVSLSGIYDFSDAASLSESTTFRRNPDFVDNCQNYIGFTSYLNVGYDAAAKAASPDYQTNINTTHAPILFVSADADTIPKNQFDLLNSILTINSADYESIWRVTGSNFADPNQHAFSAWTKTTTLNTGPPIVRDYVIDFMNRKLATVPLPTPTPSPGSGPKPPPQYLANISTRVQVQSGDNVMICGFIIGGDAKKDIVIRALGPSLADSGLKRDLTDPVLELYDSKGASLEINDNWTTLPPGTVPPELEPTSPAESVIVTSLPPGSYTAVLRSADGSTGDALCEVYDLAPADSTVRNISTRGAVGTGDDVMIGGFILGGTESSKVIVRAIGPSLGAAGVTGALADPVLELHDGQGSLIFQNDNWRSDQEKQIIDTTVAPSNDKESAVVATLPPGDYTVIIHGAAGTTGVALVEVYSLDPNASIGAMPGAKN